jgi:hypothetical protein
MLQPEQIGCWEEKSPDLGKGCFLVESIHSRPVDGDFFLGREGAEEEHLSFHRRASACLPLVARIEIAFSDHPVKLTLCHPPIPLLGPPASPHSPAVILDPAEQPYLTASYSCLFSQ